MKNPYGLRNGELVTADSVSRGLDSDCTCPACGHPLQSHQGELKRPYFSHYRGSDCGAGYETALHLMAKDVLAKHKRLLLPELKVVFDMKVAIVGTFAETEHLVKPWTRISFDSIELEKRVDSYIPDVIMTIGDRRLLVEIRVTHAVDNNKREWVVANDYPMIEYNFSAMPHVVQEQELKSALIDTYKKCGMGRGEWIHHPKLATTKDRLTRMYLDKLEAKHQSQLAAIRQSRMPSKDPQQTFDFNS